MIESERDQSVDLANMLDKVVAAAHPNVVFGEPVQSGAYTVITASEVAAGGGFGYGAGTGSATSATDAQEGGTVGGHGGGGGGGSMGRPVAVISIGPEGVKVEPIVDVSKLGIAAITAWGALVVFLVRTARRAR